jgi:hypothetical protein
MTKSGEGQELENWKPETGNWKPEFETEISL